MRTPPTRYAKSGDASIAYQVVGDGPIDIVLVLGFATHLEVQWDFPPLARFFERISAFSRLIIFDKRGTGLSDPVTEAPDYPWASPEDALRESAAEFIAPYWGQQPEGLVELFAPSLADGPQTVDFFGRLERSAASPGMVRQLFEMF